MKKAIAAILVLAMALVMTACSGQGAASTGSNPASGVSSAVSSTAQ